MRLGIHLTVTGGTAALAERASDGTDRLRDVLATCDSPPRAAGAWGDDDSTGHPRRPTDGPHRPDDAPDGVRAAAALAACLPALLGAAARRTGQPPTVIVLEVADLLRDFLRERLLAGPPRCALLRIRPAPPRVVPGRGPERRALADERWAAGGFDIFGTRLRELDLDAVERAAQAWHEQGIESIAVAGAGSVLRPDDELAVAELLTARHPQLTVWLSHEVDGLGLPRRESATVLQAVLHPLARRLEAAAHEAAGHGVRLHAATGEGGLMTLQRWRDQPLAGLDADCAALAAGASRLARQRDCHVATVSPAGDGAHVCQVRDSHLAGPRQAETGAACSHRLTLSRLGSWARSLPLGSPLLLCGELPLPAPAASADDGPVTHQLPEAATVRAFAAATSEPVTCLERIVTARSRADLDRAVEQLAEQSFAALVAQGGQPGTERLVDVHAAALPFVLPGAYRIRLRAAARRPDDIEGRTATDGVASAAGADGTAGATSPAARRAG